MQSRKIGQKFLIMLSLTGVGLVGAPVLAGPSACLFAQNAGNSDAKITSEVQHRLRNKNYKDITVNANDGTVRLSGQVDLLIYKINAVKEAKKVRGVHDVQDNIAIGGPSIPDNVLEQRLLSRIEVDRVGFGQVFDAIGVSVNNGVVTLNGHALGPVAKSSAIGLVQNTKGVKGLVDHISVDPVSPMDNRIRVQTYRAIYGFPALRRYAIVPAKPIRISVQNGRVTLYGTVDSTMDKQLAYTRAMQVPGVFGVTNNLHVSTQPNEKK